MQIKEFCDLHGDPSLTMEDRFPLKHHFGGGVYAREMFAEKGSLVVGKIHKHACIATVLKGEMEILTENGRKLIHGGDIIISQPGMMRAGFAYEDTVFVTYHATNKLDPEEIINDITVLTFEDFDRFIESQKLLECIP